VGRSKVSGAILSIEAFPERTDGAYLAVALDRLKIHLDAKPGNLVRGMPERYMERRVRIVVCTETHMAAPDKQMDAAIVGVTLARHLEVVERGVIIAAQKMRQPELIVNGRIVGIESQTLQQRINGFIVSAEFDQHAANVEVRQKSTFQIGNDAELFRCFCQQTVPMVIVAEGVVRLCEMRVMLQCAPVFFHSLFNAVRLFEHQTPLKMNNRLIIVRLAEHSRFSFSWAARG
jgi:hypothetical protein